jgi:hypothetical protein
VGIIPENLSFDRDWRVAKAWLYDKIGLRG